MIIRQEIEELRGNQTPQLRAQARMLSARERWAEAMAAKKLLAEMALYGDGASLHDCHGLQAMMRGAPIAQQLIGCFVEELTDALAAQPLGQIPFRHNVGEAGASLILASSGRAQLLLTERAPIMAKAETAVFNMIERHDCILAGSGRAIVAEYQGNDASPKLNAMQLGVGATFSSSPGNKRRALLIEEVAQSLLTLRLVRHPAPTAAKPAIEVSLADGSVVHRAAATIAESRQELALSLLGAMGRADAAPIAAQMAQDGPDNLRWQALRQALTLDTATGFAALSGLAAQSDDPLFTPANTLRDELIAAHPVLAQIESTASEYRSREHEPCPA